MSKSNKSIVIFAGPNGAGKTTFARAFLAQAHVHFINADLIAAGLSPFAPEPMALRAGRLMLEEIVTNVARNESFAFETTLSGMGWLRHIRQWRAQGWHIALHFLALKNVDTAIDRVAIRVRQGGHSIPEAVIRRRFTAGLRNFEQHYKHAVNKWFYYDNSANEPMLLTSGENP